MSYYKGRVALVTGASSGIGAAIAEALVKQGLTVVGAARRVDRIQALSEKLKREPGRLIAKKLDLTKQNEIQEIFKSIEKELGGVDVLINNAGVSNFKPIHKQSNEEINFLTNVNHVGGLLASREAINGFISRGIDDGYIINMNSVFGQQVPFFPGISLGIYPSTKFAIRATSQALRHDVKNAGQKVRVTNISPGAVTSEMSENFTATTNIKSDNILEAEEVAKTVTFVLSLPKTTEITEIVIRPTGEVF